MTKNRKPTFYIAAFCLPILFIVLLCNSGTISFFVRDGILLCVTRVVPSLFVFSVLGEMLVRSSIVSHIPRFVSRPFCRLLNISPAGFSAFVFGNLCGFPLGGKIVADLYKNGSIEKDESQRLLAFCNNTGPSFTVFLIGEKILGNIYLGLFLYFLQILLSVSVGIVLSGNEKAECAASVVKAHFSLSDFSESIAGASSSSVTVCGFIVFFYTLSGLITTFCPSAFISSVISAILEVTSGINAAAGLANRTVGASVSAFALMFSGISVISQTAAICLDSDISLGLYAKSKFICGIVAAVITFISTSIFPSLIPSASASVLWLFENGIDISGSAVLCASLVIFFFFNLPKMIARRKEI